MYCASCHKAKTAPKAKRKRDWFLISTAVQFAIGLLVLWFTAFLLGRVLLQLPQSFHQGTVWEAGL